MLEFNDDELDSVLNDESLVSILPLLDALAILELVRVAVNCELCDHFGVSDLDTRLDNDELFDPNDERVAVLLIVI